MTKQTDIVVVGEFSASNLAEGAETSGKHQAAINNRARRQQIQILEEEAFLRLLTDPAQSSEALSDE